LKVIDTLTAGFSEVTRKLWLATVPIVLDIFLWVGPKLSISPVIDEMVDTFGQTMAAVPSMGASEGDLFQTVELVAEEMRSTIGRTNLLSLLGWGRLGMPGIAGIRPIDPAVDRIVEITGYGQMLLAQLVIMAVGLFIACAFLAMLAQATRDERFDLAKLSAAIPLFWLRLMAVLVPLGIGLILVVFAGLLLGPFAFVVWAILLWLLIYVSFVPQAIAVSGKRPWAAVWQSLSLVRLNFWPAIGLLLLTNIIGAGMSLMWRLLMVSPVGTVVAIVANAYVGTGLTMATFIFYRDRVERSQEPSAEMASKGNV